MRKPTEYKYIEPQDLKKYVEEVGYILQQNNSYAVIRVIGGGAMVLGYGGKSSNRRY